MIRPEVNRGVGITMLTPDDLFGGVNMLIRLFWGELL